MQKQELHRVILTILGIALAAILLTIGGLAILSYWQRWYLQPDAGVTYGNFLFIAGLLLVIVGGFLVGGVRQMPMGQGAFIKMQSIGTEAELDNSAHSRLVGLAGFLHTYRATISLVLAGLVILVLGASIQSLLF
jgi:hypothetical protein